MLRSRERAPRADVVKSSGFRYALHLAPGEARRISYVNVVAETEAEGQAIYDALIRDVSGELDRVRSEWNTELKAIYTPGNDRYGGHLPELDTCDAEIRKLYWIGALGVIYFRRDSPFSVLGRTYDTLMPRCWQTVTFLWDYFLSMQVHSLLDPDVMRKYLEHWMCTDIYRHFGTEYLTGGPVGNWYSVNDYAMVSMVREYVGWTGRFELASNDCWQHRQAGHRLLGRLCPKVEGVQERQWAGGLWRYQ